MHFILSLALTMVGGVHFDLEEQAKKFEGRLHPLQMLDDLPEKPVPRLMDFMTLPDFNKAIPKMDEDSLAFD